MEISSTVLKSSTSIEVDKSVLSLLPAFHQLTTDSLAGALLLLAFTGRSLQPLHQLT